jgi:hypothetical protein
MRYLVLTPMAKKGLMCLGVLLLVGCTQVSVESSPTPTFRDEAENEAAAPEESNSPAQEGPGPCTTSVQGALEEVINSQTTAFGSDDFELAYSFASPRFRATTTFEQFVAIINGSYGPLISSSELVYSDCFVSADEQAGLINVRFIQESNDVYALQYLMVQTSGGWKVQGASNLQRTGEGA